MTSLNLPVSDCAIRRLVDNELGGMSVAGAGGIIFVCHQHILPTLVPLISYIATHITCPENVFLLGKPYSTIPSAYQAIQALGVRLVKNHALLVPGEYVESIRQDVNILWDEVCRHRALLRCSRIVILDEGGFLAGSVPETIKQKSIAIEQTQFGARRNDIRVPTIQVATSAAKRHFESSTITDGVWKRLALENKLQPGIQYGVIGLGFLGSCLARKLGATGHNVIGYDPVPNPAILSGITIAASVQEVIAQAEIVISCSGFDVLPLGVVFDHPVELISISSADIEFSSLMKHYKVERTYLHSPIQIDTQTGQVTIANGGFPYNFDGKQEFENPRDIFLTRLLMVASIAQALSISSHRAERISMSVDYQMKVAEYWVRHFSSEHHTLPSDLEWWAANSESNI